MVDDPEPRVRLALARHTARLFDSTVTQLLLDPDENVTTEALWRLLETPREQLASAIRMTARDARPRVRRAGCRALGRVAAAVDADLVERLGDPEPLVRDAALRALCTRHPDDVATVLAERVACVRPGERPILLYAIARIDPDVADDSVRRLDLVHDESPATRIAAAHCCAGGSHDLLLELAGDENADVRHAARRRLARE